MNFLPTRGKTRSASAARRSAESGPPLGNHTPLPYSNASVSRAMNGGAAREFGR